MSIAKSDISSHDHCAVDENNIAVHFGRSCECRSGILSIQCANCLQCQKGQGVRENVAEFVHVRQRWWSYSCRRLIGTTRMYRVLNVVLTYSFMLICYRTVSVPVLCQQRNLTHLAHPCYARKPSTAFSDSRLVLCCVARAKAFSVEHPTIIQLPEMRKWSIAIKHSRQPHAALTLAMHSGVSDIYARVAISYRDTCRVTDSVALSSFSAFSLVLRRSNCRMVGESGASEFEVGTLPA